MIHDGLYGLAIRRGGSTARASLRRHNLSSAARWVGRKTVSVCKAHTRYYRLANHPRLNIARTVGSKCIMDTESCLGRYPYDLPDERHHIGRVALVTRYIALREAAKDDLTLERWGRVVTWKPEIDTQKAICCQSAAKVRELCLEQKCLKEKLRSAGEE